MFARRVLFLLLLSGACQGRGRAVAASAPAVDVGAEIRAACLELTGAYHADHRRDVLARLRDHLPDLGPRILAVIGDPANPGFAMAATLAAELSLEDAAARLLDVANDRAAPNRAIALGACNRLGPVPTKTLAGLLVDGDADLQRAVLAAMAGRSDIPFEVVVPLLTMADVAVESAAVIPLELTPEQTSELGAMALANRDTAATVVRELAKRPIPASIFAVWLERLPLQPSPVQAAVLAAVAVRRDVSLERLPRDLVRSSPSAAVGLAALRCLVAANAVDADWLRGESRSLPRPHRIVCGIGLLQLGDREGARVLFQVAFGTDAVDDVTHVARQVLSRAANLPLHHGEPEFAEWSERSDAIRVDTPALLAMVPGALVAAVDQ